MVSKVDYLIDGEDPNEEFVPFVVIAPGNEGLNKVAKEILALSFVTEFVSEEELASGPMD